MPLGYLTNSSKIAEIYTEPFEIAVDLVHPAKYFDYVLPLYVPQQHFPPGPPTTVAPQFLATEDTQGLWPLLDSVFSAGSFKAENAATRRDVFYASEIRYALGLK